MIRFLILFSFVINLFFVFLSVFSSILVLSTSSLPAKINFPLRPRSASFLVIPAFNVVLNYTLLIHIDTSFPLMSNFLISFLSSLPHLLLVPRSYLYLSSFPFQLYHPSPQLLQLDCYRFIRVTHVLTPILRPIHLLWCPLPRRRSSRLPPIFPFPFGKVLVLLVTLILFIISSRITAYLHHILLLFPPCKLSLSNSSFHLTSNSKGSTMYIHFTIGRALDESASFKVLLPSISTTLPYCFNTCWKYLSYNII